MHFYSNLPPRAAGKFWRWLALIIIPILAAAGNSRSADTAGVSGNDAKYRQALLGLREGATADAVKKSLAILNEAGEAAFPVLVSELGNSAPAAKKFFVSDVWEIDPVTQVAKNRKLMTLGDVAFAVMQESIEENFPRKFRFFQVLTKENIAAWLAKYPYFSLFELRGQAAREALAKAERQYQIDQSPHSREAVNFLRGVVDRYPSP